MASKLGVLNQTMFTTDKRETAPTDKTKTKRGEHLNEKAAEQVLTFFTATRARTKKRSAPAHERRSGNTSTKLPSSLTNFILLVDYLSRKSPANRNPAFLSIAGLVVVSFVRDNNSNTLALQLYTPHPHYNLQDGTQQKPHNTFLRKKKTHT